MKPYINYYLLGILIFLFSDLIGQEPVETTSNETEFSEFKLDGQFRTRFEYSPSAGGRNMLVAREIADGINTPSGMSIWQRSRIGASYKSNRFETRFSFQDVRPFLANKGATAPYWQSSNGNTLGVHEAWGKYYLIQNDDCNLGLKVGRQELKNSDARLFWHREWNHYGGAFDAVALEGRNKKYALDWDLVWALNSVDAPTLAADPFRNMAYLEVKKYFGDVFTLNAINVIETFEEANDYNTGYYRNTLGVNPVFSFGNLKAEGSFYRQMGLAGETPAEESINYAGMLYTVSASYKADIYTFSAGFDTYTGSAWDDDGSDNKAHRFQAVCWAGHRYFGNTDFHLRYGQNEGLRDIYAKAKADFNTKTSLLLGFHSLWFANSAGQDSNGDEVTALGSNIDFTLVHRPVKDVVMQAGYSVMLPSSGFTELTLGQGVDAKFHGWAWAMLTFRPNFLNI